MCLGASAGGLRSLEAVLASLPSDLPWPVVVAQHVAPHPPSHLASVLAHATPLRVKEAEAGERLLPGVVYTSPSDAELGIGLDMRVTLRPLSAAHPSRIDHLFAAASAAAGPLAVAVVLSGTGTDGAAGALMVQLNGGTVIAESPDSAEHPGMPLATIQGGKVDAILPRADIGPYVGGLAKGALEDATEERAQIVRAIAELVGVPPAPDLARYRVEPIQRRVRKRMALLGEHDLAAYLRKVRADPAERAMLAKHLLITVTQFFRDADAWGALRRDVVARLVARGGPIRVWCAGCGSGEEAYSVALLFAEALGDEDARRVSILATDVDEEALERGRAAAYPPPAVASVDAARRARFFTSEGHRVGPLLRDLVEFRRHDLSREEPPGTFDLIVCRNVLIYFGDDLQSRVLRSLHAALAPGGFLFLGRSEAILKHQDRFAPLSGRMRIFRRADDEDAAHGAPGDEAAAEPGRALAEALLDSPTVLALLVDERSRILVANRKAREVLGTPAVGAPITEVLSDASARRLTDRVQEVLATGVRAFERGVRLGGVTLDVSIEPRIGSGSRAAVLLAHESVEGAWPSLAGHVLSAHAPEAEDLVATNEELQSANEELAATNEELQAANEELAALNEEFRSNNDLLGSSNERMETEAVDIRAASVLLRSIIEETFDPVIVVDEERRVAICNGPAQRELALPEDAIGEHVAELDLGVETRALHGMLDRSERDGRLHQARVAPQGKPMLLRVQHLPSSAGRTLGWVLRWHPS
ncbi:MAG: two-component system, chemotaxis family, CheB/CheR fusion protein [Thermoplasmata archaeon]|nr:two-component system, chemotaxis family, CheB/CheR fusion protein [Thermoplasmata archaeon]